MNDAELYAEYWLSEQECELRADKPANRASVYIHLILTAAQKDTLRQLRNWDTRDSVARDNHRMTRMHIPAERREKFIAKLRRAGYDINAAGELLYRWLAEEKEE